MARVKPNLLPGAPQAMKLQTMIRDRFDLSWTSISQRFDDWDDVEENYRAFRMSDDEDEESFRKYGVQKIVVPIQFATVQTLVTFMMETFTSLKPVLRCRGADPASVRPAKVMELMLDYDYRGNRGYFMLYNWFLNVFRYGYCPMENSWGRTSVLKRQMREVPSDQTIEIDGQEFQMPGGVDYVNEWLTTFEGNKWRVMDPRTWFPDPRWPLARFQEAEFCGKRDFVHDNELRRLEDDGIFFNTTKISSEYRTGSTRDAELGTLTSRRDKIAPEQAFVEAFRDARRRKMHVLEELVVELVPRDYELSEEDRPEKWIFDLVDGTTIVRAEPSPFYRFPYQIMESFPDILAFMGSGFMELTQPLAAHLSFLFNSHMSNVRKAINDVLLIDPSRIDLRDVLDPGAGKLVRLMPTAYGTDPATAIKQLLVQDITQGHFQDAKVIMDLWERITGVAAGMFGQVASGRRSASELQGVFRASGARMKMLADLMSSEGIAPLTEDMAVLRQENMSKEQFVEIVGRSAAELGVRPDDIITRGDQQFLNVHPSYIQGVFEYPAEEGVLPQDRQAAAQILHEVFQDVAQAPFLASVFDPVEIFREMIRQMGLHNIDDFLKKGIRTQVNILEDERVRELLAVGKIQPLNIGGGPGNGRGRPNEHVRERQRGLDVAGYENGAGIPGAGSI